MCHSLSHTCLIQQRAQPARFGQNTIAGSAVDTPSLSQAMVKTEKVDVHSRLSSQQGRTFEKRGNVTRHGPQTEFFSAQEHVGKPGMHRDLGHGASMRGERASTIQCAQIA
jgi:hypothetical protein